MNRTSRALAAIATALLVSLPAHADDYKIGVLHVERLLQQSAAAKAAHDRIEQEFKARDADIGRKEQEIRDAAAQLEKARATYEDAAILTRLNVTRAVREAERTDLIEQHQPPMNLA